MRRVRVSASALRRLAILLEQGTEKFGEAVVDDKRRLVEAAMRSHLARFPRTGAHDKRLDLYRFGVSETPFVDYYEFDSDELRVHFVVHERQDARRLTRSSVRW